MYIVPSDPSIKEVIITADTVRHKVTPKIIHE